MERYFTRMDLGDNEAGLRYEDGVLVELLAPGSRRLYWKGQTEQRLERIDLTQDYRLSAALVAQLHQPNLRDRALAAWTQCCWSRCRRSRSACSRSTAPLPACCKPDNTVSGATTGKSAWNWSTPVSRRWRSAARRSHPRQGQPAPEPRRQLALQRRTHRLSRLSKPLEYLYRELQFGLRAAVGTRTLDELLENKQSIDEAVSAHLAAKLEDSGLEVSGLGVRDIILPGEMKTLLAQVVEAEKAAQANVIRRREKPRRPARC